MEDQVLRALYEECQAMEVRDKTGMSAIEVMRPWQMLYNYLMVRVGGQIPDPSSEEGLKKIMEARHERDVEYWAEKVEEYNKNKGV
jgi:hypothetical protein